MCLSLPGNRRLVFNARDQLEKKKKSKAYIKISKDGNSRNAGKIDVRGERNRPQNV